MKQIIVVMIALAASARFAAAQSANEPYRPGLGEFMTATQIRHAKLWFAGKQKNWELAAYEIDEIREGLEDARRLFPSFDGIPVAEMMKTIIDPRLAELEKVIGAKNSDKFTVAFDELTAACNACHAAANKSFIRIQRPVAAPLSNQNFAPAD